MSPSEILTDIAWNSLVPSIKRERCVLIIGPGAVTRHTDGAPILDALGEYLLEKLRAARPEMTYPLDGRPMLEVGQAVRTHVDTYNLQGWVKEFYEGCSLGGAELIALCGLPFPYILNTVPGAPIEQVVSAAGRVPRVDYYNYYSGESPESPVGSAVSPLVYHLFGSARDEDALDSLVVSESALLDFLVSAVSETPALPANLRAHLKSRNTSFLFLGFELHQWHLRTLVHALFLKEAGRRNQSFALEAIDSGGGRGSGGFYWEENKIEFVEAPFDEFVRELVERFGPRTTGLGRGSADVGAARVFISYSSNDGDAAGELAGALRDRNVEVWWDEDLRGGDRWPDVIEERINNVNYFVILQTPNLRARRESYVYDELKAALKRRRRFAKGEKFIIPILCGGPGNRLKEISDEAIQDIDHTTWPEVADRIAEAITASDAPSPTTAGSTS